MVVAVMVAAREQRGADDIDRETDDRDDRLLAKGDVGRVDEANRRFEPDAEREQAEARRRGETREVAYLSGAQTLAGMALVPQVLSLGQRGNPQRPGWRRHFDAARQLPHRPVLSADAGLAPHR